jgi:hypothetical protein
MPQTKEHSNSILDQFIPEVLGLFWITPDELARDIKGFDDFNYLFDGLISQYIYGQKDKDNKNNKNAHMFFTKNFNEKIFLAHLKTKDYSKSQVNSEIDEQISLIKIDNDSRKIILIYDQTQDQWFLELKKRYPQFEFKELEI